MSTGFTFQLLKYLHCVRVEDYDFMNVQLSSIDPSSKAEGY